jgi:anaerobic magnesium-protoporphyrin IX monomethyl ester cyclase
MSTANAYLSLRTVQIAKKNNAKTVTVLGGQHFTALASETLRKYPEVDCVILGEGEETITELVKSLIAEEDISKIKGLATRQKITEAPVKRDLICDLDSLPYPAYHHVACHMKEYYFSLMAEKESRFAIIEGSRGCSYKCSYCSQSPFWKHTQRLKSSNRIVNEIETLNTKYGTSFFWFTDDHFSLGAHASAIAEGIIDRCLKISWFCQARCDDIVKHKETLPLLRKSGCVWMLVGFDTPNAEILSSYRRSGLTKDNSKEAVNVLRENEILSQGTFIIGHRTDDRKTLADLRDYANWLDPDIATFMALTPYPGTEIYETAKQNNWIEDENWSHYDMIHSIMPTETLTRDQVQEELHRCYSAYFGNWDRRLRGMRSKNPYVKKTYQYLAKQALMNGLRSLF